VTPEGVGSFGAAMATGERILLVGKGTDVDASGYQWDGVDCWRPTRDHATRFRRDRIAVSRPWDGTKAQRDRLRLDAYHRTPGDRTKTMPVDETPAAVVPGLSFPTKIECARCGAENIVAREERASRAVDSAARS
jgi:hypothetical protein